MIQCPFDEAWIGPCCEPVEDGKQFCYKHSHQRCREHGRQAIRNCDHATSLVCGAPLCDKCSYWCSSHLKPIRDDY